MTPTVFSLDPGSKQTGWAVLTMDERLVEAGLLLPDRVWDDAATRLAAMKQSLIALLDQYRPQVIVIEWTSGKVIKSRHTGGGAGLPIYGVAVGAFWQVCEYWAEACRREGRSCAVVRIAENEWTQGRPKLRRRIGGTPALSRVDLIEHRFPSYVPEKDPGGDVADAIGVNLHYQRRQRLLHQEAR
ncbi:MAG: hypothetical protein JXB13_00990 [Phycisphaerae bacterium]|nr:hypothetical protein [Phycisphaerae bacterium]